MEQMGPLAPLVFFGLNVAQIVVAPIPGYPVQILGGVLFGVIPGSIYTVGGMVAGGTLAAWLGRRLGRPWLERRLADAPVLPTLSVGMQAASTTGAEALARWSKIAHIDSFWTWWLILLLPLGDLPYFFAGLSRIRLGWFALAILASRGPFTVLIVWAGDRVIDLPLSWIALFVAGLGLLLLVGFSQRDRLESWGRAYIASRE